MKDIVELMNMAKITSMIVFHFSKSVCKCKDSYIIFNMDALGYILDSPSNYILMCTLNKVQSDPSKKVCCTQTGQLFLLFM